MRRIWIGVLLCLALALPVSAGPPRIELMADGFRVPWSLAFMPDGAMLITERGGRLWRLGPDGKRQRITGLPRVAAQGQGGLFDVVVARDFATSGEVFLSFARPQAAGSGAALAVARLRGNRLENLRVLFEMAPGNSGGRHFGGRIVEARDGALYLTLGDRGQDAQAQNLATHNGTIVRIARQGGAAPGNPFAATPGALPEIWSYGHRNPQGAALDAAGTLWAVEHGAKGGDEVNRIARGANYGWPVIAYGRHYSGARIGEGTAKPGMQQPAFYWDPSIAPSGMVIYSGRLWPEWKGAFLIGSLKFDHIAILSPGAARQIDTIATPETIRVRDLRQGPDGAIWFLSEGNGALYRMTPG